MQVHYNANSTNSLAFGGRKPDHEGVEFVEVVEMELVEREGQEFGFLVDLAADLEESKPVLALVDAIVRSRAVVVAPFIEHVSVDLISNFSRKT